MTEDDLRRLREKYGKAKGGDVFDPEFRKVAETLFSDSDNRKLAYANPATFLSARYLPDFIEDPGRYDLDAALIGVPVDLAVTNHPGTRFGPRAVRTHERVPSYHHVHRMVPSSLVQFADVGDVPFAKRFDINQCHDDIFQFYDKICEAGVAPFSVGGDHSISYPILRAMGKNRPVGMVQFDAHCDTAGEYDGTRFHHGGPFRQAVLDGVLDPTRTVQVGIRGSAEYLWEFSYDSGMTVIHMEDVEKQGTDAIIAQIRKVIGDGPTYVSFDVDGVDPAFAPGTGTPEPGGFSTRQVLDLLYGLKGANIIGGDVVEISPALDPTANTAHLGMQVLFEMLCLYAGRPG